MKIYRGMHIQDPDPFLPPDALGEIMVFVDDRPLSPEPSQKLINHSPDGFSWGYLGSGPSQLSLALLLDALDDEERAEHLYQSFKFRVVARWPSDKGWRITQEEIKEICNELEHRNT